MSYIISIRLCNRHLWRLTLRGPGLGSGTQGDWADVVLAPPEGIYG